MNINALGKIMKRRWVLMTLLVAVTLLPAAVPPAHAQDQYDQYDPPSRVARLGYMQGSVSFQPAGESEWVEAVANRPMTTGDRLWADRDGRAEVELGSASIHLAPNTGFSFLNLDDRTVQIELSSGTLDVRVRRLDRDSVFEVDTPNQALTAFQPGRYRIEASEDGNYTVVTIREGEGESTGNGQAYTLHAGQRITLSGTDSLNAEVQQIAGPDEFDNWSYSRDRRYDNSRSSQYCSPDLVGVEDLDDYGDWRSDSSYGSVWFPRVSSGWAPYHDGHWAWIDPWGWTWVDDSPWGYAPFHYGRWASVGGRWGWIPGPRHERSVYAPALVAFVGGGSFAAGSVAWFPLGPREVYVPSYRVSRGYVNRVNITNTTVNTTTVTNVYNTTIVNKSTTVTNVNYMNRNVQGAVTAVPQRAFSSAQPVARNAVRVNARDMASAPVNVRAAVPPAREAVLGARANTANRVAAPPKAVAARTVIAKATPPPTPASFAARQQVLQAHPGQAVDRTEMQKLRPAAPATRQVKQAPPAKAATPTQAKANAAANGNPAPNARPGANAPQPARPQPNNQPAPNNRPEANRPEANRPEANRPEPNRPEANRAPQPPARNERPANAEPNNRPNQPPPNNRPDANRPEPNRPEANRAPQPPARNERPANAEPNNRPDQPANNNRPDANRPEPNRPEANRAPQPPARNERPANAEPNNRPNQPPPNNRPDANRPEPNRPEANRAPQPPDRNDRPANAEPNNRPNPPANNNRPEANRPESNRPAQPPARSDRPANAEPNNRPNQPARDNRPEANRPESNRPAQPPARSDRPANAEPNNRPNQPARDNRPEANPPQDQREAKPAGNSGRQPPKPLTPEEKRRQDQQRKEESPPPQ